MTVKAATIEDFRSLLGNRIREQHRNLGKATALIQAEAMAVGAPSGNRIYFDYLEELERAWREAADFKLRELRRWTRRSTLDRAELRNATEAALRKLHSALVDASKIRQTLGDSPAAPAIPKDVNDRIDTLYADIDFRLRQFDIDMDDDEADPRKPGGRVGKALAWIGDHLVAMMLGMAGAVLLAWYGLSSGDRNELQNQTTGVEIEPAGNLLREGDPPAVGNAIAPKPVLVGEPIEEPNLVEDSATVPQDPPTVAPAPRQRLRNESLNCPASIIIVSLNLPGGLGASYDAFSNTNHVEMINCDSATRRFETRFSKESGSVDGTGTWSESRISFSFGFRSRYTRRGTISCTASGSAVRRDTYVGNISCSDAEGHPLNSGVTIQL